MSKKHTQVDPVIAEAMALGKERAAPERRAPHQDVIAAVARAERIVEHLSAFVLVGKRRTRSLEHERNLRGQAAEVDRLWEALMRTSTTRDQAMRFVAAVQHAAALDVSADVAAGIAKEILCARYPELEDPELIVDLASGVEAWRARAKWERLLAIVERVMGAQPFGDGSAMRDEYKRWRKKLKT